MAFSSNPLKLSSCFQWLYMDPASSSRYHRVLWGKRRTTIPDLCDYPQLPESVHNKLYINRNANRLFVFCTQLYLLK